MTCASGDGLRVDFWNDTRCGDSPLHDQFADLSCWAMDKEASVVSYMGRECVLESYILMSLSGFGGE